MERPKNVSIKPFNYKNTVSDEYDDLKSIEENGSTLLDDIDLDYLKGAGESMDSVSYQSESSSSENSSESSDSNSTKSNSSIKNDITKFKGIVELKDLFRGMIDIDKLEALPIKVIQDYVSCNKTYKEKRIELLKYFKNNSVFSPHAK